MAVERAKLAARLVSLDEKIPGFALTTRDETGPAETLERASS